MTPARRQLCALLLPVLLLAAVDQALLHSVLADDWFRGAALAPYDPPLFNAAQAGSLERLAGAAPGEASNVRFDPDLGWAPAPGSRVAGAEYDQGGARVGRVPIMHSRTPGLRRAVAVGCSFTHGDEVEGHAAWPAVVDEARAGLEVANLGVGAYGLDQALLRYRRDGRPFEPEEIWVGWMPSATPRLLSVYPPALRHHDLSVSFKPRFKLDAEGRLVMVPLPARTGGGIAALLGDQAAFLDATRDDAFVRRALAAYQPRGSHPLHHSGIGRILLTRYERGGRAPEELFADPTAGLEELFVAVAGAFLAERAPAGGAGPEVVRLIVLPDQKSLAHLAGARAKGEPPWWSRAARALERQGALVHDLAAELLDAGALDDPDFWQPGGHYSPAGNRRVAEALLARLH